MQNQRHLAKNQELSIKKLLTIGRNELLTNKTPEYLRPLFVLQRANKMTTLANGDYALRKKILLEWIPNAFRSGGTPSMVSRHIKLLSDILGLIAVPTFLPGKVHLFLSDRNIEQTSLSDIVSQEKLVSHDSQEAFGLEASVGLLTPVTISAAPTSISEMYVLSVGWGFNLPLFERMENYLEDLNEGKVKKLTLERVAAAVAEFSAVTPLYSSFIIVLAYGILSGTMAFAFFGGDYYDALVTFLLGALAGMFVVLCDYKPFSFNIIHEFVSSFSISLFSLIATHLSNGALHFWPMFLSGTIWILPGFSMVIGFSEAIRKFHVTGFLQHIQALLVAFIMGLGFLLSFKCVAPFSECYLLEWPNLPTSSLSTVMRFVLCGCFAIACSIIYHSHLQHMIFSLVASLFCFALVLMVGEWNGIADEVVAFPFALFVTLFCRIIGGLTRQTHLAALFVAILPLVPGSRIVRSCVLLLQPIHMSSLDLRYFPFFASSIFVSLAVAFGVFCGDSLYTAYLRRPVIKPLRERFLLSYGDPEETSSLGV